VRLIMIAAPGEKAATSSPERMRMTVSAAEAGGVGYLFRVRRRAYHLPGPIVQGMKCRGIRRELLDLLLAIGASNDPNEFVALLREQDGVIEECDLVPGTVTNEDSASVLLDMMPLDTHRAGSAHSHPNGVLEPSNADLGFFPRTGRYHLIIGWPYGEGDWACFTADGAPYKLEVLP
jgi:proteasome lid subunit RPN8/RPN11